jgi:hypothetical protein
VADPLGGASAVFDAEDAAVARIDLVEADGDSIPRPLSARAALAPSATTILRRRRSANRSPSRIMPILRL